MFSRGCQPENLSSGRRGNGDYIGYLGLALGQSACLIQQHCSYLVRPFQCLTTADKNAVLGSLASADHDRRRCCQSQGAGTGNNEHGDKIKEGKGEGGSWPHEVPDYESSDGNANHYRHEVAGDDISQALDRRFASLGFLHQPDNLSQGGILTHLGRLKLKAARLINGGTDNLITFPFLYRNTLSGNHGLVNAGIPLANNAVHRHSLTRPHQNKVTNLNIINGNFYFSTVTDNQSRLRLHTDELFYRL